MAALAALLVAGLLAGGPLTGTALAHEERDSTFPAGTGSVPTYRPYSQDLPVEVVCKPESRELVAGIRDRRLRAFNERLLGLCEHRHIQQAVDAVSQQGTNIYVLPGTYREEPSWDAPCTRGYDGGIVTYELMASCGEVVNLVTITGDDPKDPGIACDGPRCRLQIEGTGARPEDVVLRGGFREDEDWVKHNGIKADRADGIYIRNLTAEQFRENAIYVHETDGYVLDRVNARHNDLYGLLTFTSDHGVISNCDTSYNGDSGVYPGSAADVNAGSSTTGRLTRWAVEIFGCNTHHNALGFSGTAGNSVYFHDNEVHHNGAGYVTDSFVGGHPGMPQDHAWLEHNKIYANNENYYERFVHTGTCAKKPGERGIGKGTVCPAFPVPVGTGVLIAGGNSNFVASNDLYDNWRAGAMLFWVPGAIRGDTNVDQQLDTSNRNHYTNNRLGFHPSGVKQPNGVDFWWDDQGVGNCWETNTSVRGAVTHNATLLLPGCGSGGSVSPVGNPAKSAVLVPCSQYNREDNNDPPGCDWFDTPAKPADRQAAPGEEQQAAGAPTALPRGPSGPLLDGLLPPAPSRGLQLPLLLGGAGAALLLAAGAARRRRHDGGAGVSPVAAAVRPAPAPVDRVEGTRARAPAAAAPGARRGRRRPRPVRRAARPAAAGRGGGRRPAVAARPGRAAADHAGRATARSARTSWATRTTPRSCSRCPVRNDGLLPVTVTAGSLTGERLPLLDVALDAPVRLGPGERGTAVLTGTLHNCRYYHEREVAGVRRARS